jgi:uncharacterized membrane protein
MKQILFTYLSALVAFVGIDLLWLGFIAKGVYQKQLGAFLSSSPNWFAAIFFYSLYAVGIVIFAVNPGLEKSQPMQAVIYGALFGFFAYMTYELTNLSVIKDWPAGIVVIDILWGACLTGLVAGIAYYVGSALK